MSVTVISTFQVDTIAAEDRYPIDSATNIETREIGPINKKGLYIAFQVTILIHS